MKHSPFKTSPASPDYLAPSHTNDLLDGPWRCLTILLLFLCDRFYLNSVSFSRKQPPGLTLSWLWRLKRSRWSARFNLLWDENRPGIEWLPSEILDENHLCPALQVWTRNFRVKTFEFRYRCFSAAFGCVRRCSNVFDFVRLCSTSTTFGHRGACKQCAF